jgi:hypothetical protein
MPVESTSPSVSHMARGGKSLAGMHAAEEQFSRYLDSKNKKARMTNHPGLRLIESCCELPVVAAACTAGVSPAEAATTAAHSYSLKGSQITSISGSRNRNQSRLDAVRSRSGVAKPSPLSGPPGSFSRKRLCGNRANIIRPKRGVDQWEFDHAAARLNRSAEAASTNLAISCRAIGNRF